MSETKQKHDSLRNIYDSLLKYVSQEHTQDHHNGFTVSPPETCLICEWIRDAEYHVETVKMLLETCKAAQDELQRIRDGGEVSSQWAGELAEECRAAIAKATGH